MGKTANSGLASPNESAADRIISGIDLIDYGAGGLVPEHVYLVKGPSGTGKTILGLQFLCRGLELNETGVLITDQKPNFVLAQARAIGFPVGDAAARGKLQILNPSRRYFELVESPADVMAIMEELGDYIRRAGARRLVLDPVYTLINTSYSAHFALSITQSLINALEDLPATTFLIAGDEGDRELAAVIRALEQNAFGVIALAPDPATGGRVMRLSKLKYAATDELRAHYRILNGRGLINYQGEGERVSDVTQPWADTPGKRILIIGSNPETIRNAREALGEGYEVMAEADLRRGVERARAEKPGLVIVTPVRSMEAVRAITELARDSESSIAFLSPSSNRSLDRVLYLRAGADDFLTEPFSPGEFRARVDALIRRSGRRLTQRDGSIPVISEDELHAFGANLPPLERRPREAILLNDDVVNLREDLKDRLQRNIDTVSKFEVPFALYWIKSEQKDAELNRTLARLCRQEDILCYNAEGEFIALLTGADEQGVRGFQSRLDEKLGTFLREANVRRGFRMCEPGERIDHL